MTKNYQLTIKIGINAIYFILMGVLLELINDAPIIGDFFRINSGTILDLALNALATMLALIMMMLWAMLLIKNVKNYYISIFSKAKTFEKETRCSVFNPFC